MRLFDRSPIALGAYGLATLLAMFELAVLWQALHPQVSDNYRAYYIDRTNTCLSQPVTGEYTLGTEIDFRSGGPNTRELRPCGWDGPAGDGMHSIGETSRLLFDVGAAQPLSLMLELTGVSLEGPPVQHVDVSANGVALGTLEVTPGRTDRFTTAVPAAVIDGAGKLMIQLDFPDAIDPSKGRVSNTHWRAVKLSAASVTPTSK